MELSKLKKRLTTATRGHKLLKDKQDELMRRFIILVRQNNLLRSDVENSLITSMQSFVMAKALLNEKFIEGLVVVPARKVIVDIYEKNIMNVEVPVMNFSYPEAEKEFVQQIVIEEMERAYRMHVPLRADCGWGKNWLEAH